MSEYGESNSCEFRPHDGHHLPDEVVVCPADGLEQEAAGKLVSRTQQFESGRLVHGRLIPRQEAETTS